MAILLLFLSVLITIDSSRVGHWDWRRSGGGLNNGTTGVTVAPSSSGSLGHLTTADADMISNEPPQSPYFSDWNRLVSGYGSQRCYKIPTEMKLCHNIGYDLMVLPNGLDHESMNEVITQSEVWMTLVNLGCHDELERFLCALYAPVCIKGYHDKLIQPCRDLCESVQAACLPTMITFGLGWPDIVKCSKFPQAPQELCIPPNKQKKSRCSGCVEKPTYESAVGSFCTADVVIRAKILEVMPIGGSSSANKTNRIRVAGRFGVFKKPENINLPLNLDFQMDCDCPMLKAAVTRSKGPARWLLMGKLDVAKKVLTIQHASKPSAQNAGIKRALRDIRRQPHSLCKVDLARPSPSSRTAVMTRRTATLAQSPHRPPPAPLSNPQTQRPQNTRNSQPNVAVSPEEKRLRRQMRRQQRKNQASNPPETRQKHGTPPASAVMHQQAMNDLPPVTPRPPNYRSSSSGYFQSKRDGYDQSRA